MAFTLVSKTVKPAEAKWWNQVDPEAAARVGEFVKAFPGVVSADAKEIEPNVWQSVIVFESKAVVEEYKVAMAANSDNALRKAYNATHGIVTKSQGQGE